MIKGVGWATVLINFMMAMFYNTIISWAVFYLVKSFGSIGSELPWKHCDHPWNSNCCIAADAVSYQFLPVIDPTKEKFHKVKMNTTSLIRQLENNCTQRIYSTEEYFKY